MMFGLASPPAERVNRNSLSGTWMQHSSGKEKQLRDPKYGFLIGYDRFVSWADFEPRKGQFKLPTAVFDDLASAGFRTVTGLSVGSYAPKWLLDEVGIKVDMDDHDTCMHSPSPLNETEGYYYGSFENGPKGCIWPDYLNPYYQERFLLAIDKFAEQLANLKFAHGFRPVVASQVRYGTTGDDGPYHGTPEKHQYAISRAQWDNFTMSLAPAICKSYNSRGIIALWNKHDNQLEAYVDACPGSMIKTGMVAHGYQINEEASDMQVKGAICHRPGVACRGESWSFCEDGHYKQSPMWGTYAHLMWQLTFGNDMPGLTGSTLINDNFIPLYRNVFNRYATSIRPPATHWIGGIVMLRDGLNSANTKRFSESKYGHAKRDNAGRMKAIVKDFAHKGAAIGDIHAATGRDMDSRHPHKLNDVGWNVYEGNYGNGLLTQLSPSDTSVGLWQVGPKDQEFGRFARQFEHSSGKTAMGFVLDERLWGGLPMKHSASRPLVIELAYFDGTPKVGAEEMELAPSLNASAPSLNASATVTASASKKQLKIYYDGADGCTNAATIDVGNTKRWKVWTQTISDGKFGKGCSGSGTSKADHADIQLRSTGSDKDIVVSTLQVYDPNGTF
jgi:hypothetical protein